VTSIRDHSFHLDSPGQTMSWKEQVFLMFCALSVNYLGLLERCLQYHNMVMFSILVFGGKVVGG
jgi:hypothetical protein